MEKTRDRLSEMVKKIASAEIKGYKVLPKVWKNYGRTRIYVKLHDTAGKRQDGELYLDIGKGKVAWVSEPDPLPAWADAVILEIKLTYLESGLEYGI